MRQSTVNFHFSFPKNLWELSNHATSVLNPEKGRGPDVTWIGLMGGGLASSLGGPVTELGLVVV